MREQRTIETYIRVPVTVSFDAEETHVNEDMAQQAARDAYHNEESWGCSEGVQCEVVFPKDGRY